MFYRWTKSFAECHSLSAYQSDAPMVLVQHMPAGFTNSMANRLDEISKINVKEAENGEILKKELFTLRRAENTWK